MYTHSNISIVNKCWFVKTPQYAEAKKPIAYKSEVKKLETLFLKILFDIKYIKTQHIEAYMQSNKFNAKILLNSFKITVWYKTKPVW